MSSLAVSNSIVNLFHPATVNDSGPGGSYTAACLAREGHGVVLLEREHFPRYHIGESLIPSMRQFLRFIDLEEQFVKFGFHEKPGAAFHMGTGKEEGYTDFILHDENNFSWNVDRAQMDNMLLRHASACGARVFEGAEVTSILFKESEDGQGYPHAVTWTDEQGKTGSTAFRYLVDASGRRGMLATKYLKDRQFTDSLKNVAHWGYWTGTGIYRPNTTRQGAPFFEALNDGSGWAWFIPLKGRTSVGIVMNQALCTLRKRTLGNRNDSLLYLYEETLKELAPKVQSLIGDGLLITHKDHPKVMMASDYSYSANSYAGLNYRIVGDAGAFIDPFFSNGVHLAISGALSAAATICASINMQCSEREAAAWHTGRVGTSYTRFLLIVLSAYKQMRALDQPVLSDINEENFDRAFNFFRPIIQGLADVTMQSSKELTEAELANTLDFCARTYMPIPQGSEAATQKLQLVQWFGTSEGVEGLATLPVNGYCMSLKRGALGLVPVCDESVTKVVQYLAVHTSDTGVPTRLHN
ncbi:hypothetical protein FPV67DRAFT_1764766 [Lyophyllum atratum]|nr:hypothetical protein FPV67DRAFT_1764766 [Lyophyllum atratum]